MSTFLIVLLVLLGLVWILLALFGNRMLDYLVRYEEEEYDKKLEDYLRKRYQKFESDRKARLKNNPYLDKWAEPEEVRLVGIRKPIGKWTRMVTMRNLQYINNFKRLIGSKLPKSMGFWQLKVRGQDTGEGRSKGRGR